MKEVNPLKGLVSFRSKEQDLFAIDYRITTKCNYSCWYCTDLHDNKKPNFKVDLEKLGSFVRAAQRPVRFFLYGGEPSLHPQFTEVIKTLSDNLYLGSVLEIQTNLSLPQKFVDCVTPIKVLASYHREECKFSTFTNNCLLLAKKNMLKQVTVMYQQEYKEEILSHYQLLKKLLSSHECNVELAPLLCGSVDEDEDNPYCEMDSFYEDRQALQLSKQDYLFQKRFHATFDDGKTELLSAGELWHGRNNSFQGMLCTVGKERVIIDSDGNCYKCFNEIFDENVTPQYNVFGDKDPKEFFENLDSLRCPYQKCFFEFNHLKTR